MFRISRGKLFAGLDIGSHSVKAVFTEVDHMGKFHVLSLSKGLSSGIKKGNIINIDAIMATVNDVITKMEHFCGKDVQETVLAVSGLSIQTIRSHVAVAVTGEDEVSEQDRQRLLLLARNVAVPEDKSILQVVEQQYIVDGNRGVKDPVGMAGRRVELEALVIIVNTLVIQNLLKCTAELGLEVLAMVYAPLLGAVGVLSQAEQEMGVVLIDLGAQKTEVSIFRHGVMEKSVVFPVGSDNITWDLAIVLKASNEEAQRVKETEKLLFCDRETEGRLIQMSSLNGEGEQEVPAWLAARIVMARLDEMSQMFSAEIFSEYAPEELPGGIVLTGGGARMDGIGLYFSQTFHLPVRIGYPDYTEPVFHDYRGPENAEVLGSAFYQYAGMEEERKGLSAPVGKLFRRVTEWVRDIME